MKKIGFTLLLTFIIISCNESTGPAEDPNFQYPVKIGNAWNYNLLISFINISPDSIANILLPIDTLYENISITGKKVLQDSIQTYALSVENKDNETSILSTFYYKHNTSGLYRIGYKNLGSATTVPKINSDRRIRFKVHGQYYNTLKELLHTITHNIPGLPAADDSVTYENPPRLSLQYPLKTGAQWMYFMNESYRIEKEIAGIENITVPAGRFSCYKIVYLYNWFGDNALNWTEDIEYTDFVSDKGLVLRKIIYRNNILTNDNGKELGRFDLQDVYELAGYTVE